MRGGRCRLWCERSRAGIRDFYPGDDRRAAAGAGFTALARIDFTFIY